MRKRFRGLLRILTWFSAIAVVFGVVAFLPSQPSLALVPGSKEWVNTWTEVEYLGDGRYGATIHSAHQVFFDKDDGNKPKKHKLTDERSTKGYVLIQSAIVSVEVYPYYARYFDPQHEEVRLYEERWVVQRLFKEPDKWRDIGAWNPRIAVEEYPEPAGDVVKVTVTYDTDYGPLTVEYFQRDGNALKHNVTFQNTSGGIETFRVVQAWAGIVGAKCNGKTIPLEEEAPFLAFQRTDGSLTIAENLSSMMINEDGTEKAAQRLQGPVSVKSHAQGMKADFVYGNWLLGPGESLEIDPDTATLDNPTEDGHVFYSVGQDAHGIQRAEAQILFGRASNFVGQPFYRRGYVEWPIEILARTTITEVQFRYHGKVHAGDNAYIYAMANQPTAQSDDEAGYTVIYDDAGDGTAYLSNNAVFSEVGTEKDVGGASGPSWDTDPKTDLQTAATAEQSWFAFGFKTTEVTENEVHEFYAEEKTDAADPKPTLYVEYIITGWAGKVSGVTNPAKVMGVDKANIQKVHGVE